MKYRIITTNLAAHIHEVEANGEQDAIDRYRMGEAREVHTETESDVESVEAVEEPRVPPLEPGTAEAGVQMGALGVRDTPEQC